MEDLKFIIFIVVAIVYLRSSQHKTLNILVERVALWHPYFVIIYPVKGIQLLRSLLSVVLLSTNNLCHAVDIHLLSVFISMSLLGVHVLVDSVRFPPNALFAVLCFAFYHMINADKQWWLDCLLIYSLRVNHLFSRQLPPAFSRADSHNSLVKYSYLLIYSTIATVLYRPGYVL